METMEEIIKQIDNGCRVKALELLSNSHYDFIGLVEKLQEQNKHEEVKCMLYTAYTIGFLKENNNFNRFR